ncbi:hypothetical protein HY494_00745 [Candidatus Woesearchaeota archaeon]|nr:hypothetical protein [Candidatus Woesearchaeota archaeon]
MITNSIDIIITTGIEQIPIRRKLATIHFDRVSKGIAATPVLNIHEIDEKETNSYLRRTNAQYDIEWLLNAYIRGVDWMKRFSDDINRLKSNPNYSSLGSYANILRVPFAYVHPTAQKELFADDAIGRYDVKEGVSVLLAPQPKPVIKGTIIHELGHHMHYSLHPKEYVSCDETIREIMAILVEEEIDPDYIYRSGSSHGKAKELLRELNQFDFYHDMSLAEKWLYLSKFKNHSVLEGIINAQ